ncbi:MAG: biopolymer transporter ExbD [bacterium]|nr:biopolymer transporter ExbD [bacterium]
MALKFKTRLKHKALIDLTALIDLVFLLVAFFMVTSSLGSESKIPVNLPRAEYSGSSQGGNVIVSVTNENEIYINDKKYDKKSIMTKFQEMKGKLKKDASVIIRGDKVSHYETIVDIIDKLNQAGISKVVLSAVK